MGHMWWAFCAGLLLAHPVTAKSQLSPHKSQQQYAMEKLRVQSFHDKNTEEQRNHMQNSDRTLLARCFICRKVVAAVEGIIEENIRRKTVPFCLTLIRKYKGKCLQRTKEYKYKLLSVMFPGGARGTCQRMGHCRSL